MIPSVVFCINHSTNSKLSSDYLKQHSDKLRMMSLIGLGNENGLTLAQ